MEMRVQALNNKGEILENAEVLVNGVPIGRTPNAIASVSGAIWKSYTIKVRCDGYNDVEIASAKEPKWLMIFLGAFVLWFLWLWAYGSKELQTIVMYKKAGTSDELEKVKTAQYQQSIGKTWQDVLKENGLDRYISVFENQNLIDVEMILSLTEQDLEKIGVETLGDRKQLIKVLHNKFVSDAEFDIPKLDNYSVSTVNTGIEEQAQQQNSIVIQEPLQEKVSQTEDNPEERYNYLSEDDRIYRALKFKEKKGFFKHILPSSWIVTVFFYGLLSLLILVITSLFTAQTNSQLLIIILSNLTIIVIPVILLIIGIKNRVKYMKEKKTWKECTDNGKKEIKEVYKEYQDIEKEYLGI
jgi:hypothetical protein